MPAETKKMTLREIDCLIAGHLFGWTHIGKVWAYHDEHGLSVDTTIGDLFPEPAGEDRDHPRDFAGLSPECRHHLSRPDLAHERTLNGAPLHSLTIIPAYTSDWNAMRLVVDKMYVLGWAVEIGSSPSGAGWCKCNSWKNKACVISGVKKSAPIAVAIGVLKAHGIEVEVCDGMADA